ncbi:MAG: terminase family protein [Gammaproteobacteria bacterium]|nr:terminase family protein [Gammaproteobacteria bacterium]
MAKQRVIQLDYTPQPRQDVLHKSKARWILYGGAAGGGKSHALRWDGIVFCLQNPKCEAYLYRRTTKQLLKNHILKVRAEIPIELGRYNASDNYFMFTNGSIMFFMHMEHESDTDDAQGQECHWLGVDEAGQFTPFQLAYLIGRLRLGSWKPAVDAERLPRAVFTANPGGPGHHFLKGRFIDGRIPEQAFVDDDTGLDSVFIPAKMDDNQYLDQAYAGQFGLMSTDMQKMLRDGDWSVVVGAYFECYDDRSYPEGNVVDFDIPDHWMRFRACDWGFNSPFSIGWYAVADGEPVNGLEIEAETLVKYREWYGYNGKTTKGNGLRLSASAVAAGMKAREKTDQQFSFSVADPSLWRTDSGPSPAEMFATAGISWHRADRQREAGWQEMYSRLRDKKLLIHSRCKHTRRTIPAVMRSDRNPEDVDKGGEDHAVDETRYACMARPWVATEPEPPPPMIAPLTFPDIFKAGRRNNTRDFI